MASRLPFFLPPPRLSPLGPRLLVLMLALASALIPQVARAQARAAEPAKSTEPLRIAAAADLEPLLPAVIAQFEQLHSGVRVSASYQSSATLATQIVSGAPVDLFLAADLSFPQRIIAAGLADGAAPVAYGRGRLVLWARKDSRFQPLTLEALRDPSIKSVAIANPEHAPYGRAAKAAILSLDLAARLRGKLVVAENVAQAAQYVDSGNAELGLLSLTSALTERLRTDGVYIEMPASSYPPIVQGAVVIKGRGNQQLAHAFLDFLQSRAVEQQLSTRGLRPPQ